MNKDQFKGALRECVGKLLDGFGKFVGNPLQQDKGVKLQNEGRLQVFLGDLKEFEKLKIHDRAFNKRWDAWVNGGG